MALRQDPDDILDYTVDWSNVLVSGESITAANWSAPGLTVSGETNNTTTATAFLAGGTAGSQYTVTCEITTSDARTYNRQFTLAIAEL